MRFDLAQGFPLVTTKKIHLQVGGARAAVVPARRRPTCATCSEHGVSIWDEWADANGELGPVYGRQWRAWGTADGREIDQIGRGRAPDPRASRFAPACWSARGTSANSRAWRCALPRAVPVLCRRRPAVLPAVPAQRRRVPRRAVQYRLLCTADAHGRRSSAICSRANSSGPAAIATSISTTWSRRTRSCGARRCPLPRLQLRRRPPTVFDYQYEDIEFVNYQFHPAIKAPVAV